MYSLMVKPAILYGLETVAVTKKQIEEMDVAKMKMLRFAMGVTRKDWIQNEYIRGTVKVERLGIKMREGRMKCYGHVIRRDQECVRRRVMKIELPGNRKKGRPKKRLIKVLKENMGELGARKKHIENRTLCRNIICCGNLSFKGKAKRRRRII